jgi:hypothetical protein
MNIKILLCNCKGLCQSFKEAIPFPSKDELRKQLRELRALRSAMEPAHGN